MLAESITADTTISLGLLATAMTAVIAAIVASVTTRTKVKELENDIREFQTWRTKQQEKHSAEAKESQAWRTNVTTSLAVLCERLPGRSRGSRPHQKADR